LECLSQTHLRVPKVYQFIQHQDENDGIQSWLLMEYLQRETIRKILTHENDSDTRYHLLFDFGRSLRELHSTSCPDELKSGKKWIDIILKQAELFSNIIVGTKQYSCEVHIKDVKFYIIIMKKSDGPEVNDFRDLYFMRSTFTSGVN